MQTKVISLFTLLFFAGSTLFAQQQRVLDKVFIGNEGVFGSTSGTITALDFQDKTISQNVFSNANNGADLGNVVQSITRIGNELYVVANNSHQIVVMDAVTFQQTGLIQISGEKAPREIRQVNDTLAYVTNLYGGGIGMVDLRSFAEYDSAVATGMNPDKMLVYEERAYVGNWGFGKDSTISVIHTGTHSVVDTLQVSRGPRSMFVDETGKLWVVCAGYAGDYDEDFNLIPGTSRPGGIHAFDLETGREEVFIEVPSAKEDFAYNAEANEAYINAGGVRRVDLEAETVSGDTLVNGNFYAMSYARSGGENYLFLTDAKDFSSAGELFVHTLDGEQVAGYTTGTVPGSFHFRYQSASDIVETNEARPKNFSLGANYPNPFNPSTNIPFTLKQSGPVALSIYAINGQKVATLVNGTMPAGSHTVNFHTGALASGIYFYRLEASGKVLTRKMILAK